MTDLKNSISNPIGLRHVLTAFMGSITGWLIVFLVLGFPIFHLGFKVPVARIASYVSICCATQLVITPWLFYARKTPQRPEGRFTHRIIALTAFTTAVSVLFFYYLRRSRPEDPSTREFTLIGMGVTLIFAILYPTVKLYLVSRREKDSNTVHSDYEEPH